MYGSYGDDTTPETIPPCSADARPIRNPDVKLMLHKFVTPLT